MKRLAVLLFLCWATVAAPPVLAQQDGTTAEEDRGFLQGLLEDSLSGAGRDVRITGFSGAISSNATIEEMTIADGEGVWLTLRGVELVWTRSALLAGRVEVDTLSADFLGVARAPVAEGEDLPAPEAGGGFSLPSLPVSINIGTLNIDRVELGAPLLGEEISVALSGSAALADGEGEARLEIERIDGAEGLVRLAGSFVNETETLTLDLAVEEGAGGLIATRAGIPDTPPLSLTVQGSGPLDDFAADMALATGGTPRLAGRVLLEGRNDGGRAFTADLSGDVRPLLIEDLRGFFGPDLAFEAAGLARADGGFLLERLSLAAEAIRLEGNAAIGADGWPDRITLSGRIAGADGAPVRVALPGAPTTLASADLDFGYDAAQGDGWTLRLDARDIAQTGLALDAVTLDGAGRIAPADAAVSGGLTLAVRGLDLPDPALSEAVGDDLDGRLDFAWQDGAPFRLTGIDLAGADYGLRGDITLRGLDGDLNFAIEPDIDLSAQELSRFAALATQPLRGAARLSAEGRVEPVTGRFDVALDGTATDLGIGQPQLDPLLAGSTRIELRASRDESGTNVERLSLTARGLSVDAEVQLRTDASTGRFEIGLPQLELVDPRLSGAADLTGTLRESASDYALTLAARAPGDARFDGDVTVAKRDAGIGEIGFAGDVAVARLSDYAALTGIALRGGLSVTAEASVDPATGAGSVTARGSGTDLATGIGAVDTVLAGRADLAVSAARDAAGTLTVDRADLATPQLTADMTGSLGTDASDLQFDARLADLGLLVEGFSGPATATGSLTAADGPYAVDVRLTGPGETRATVSGELGREFATADLSIDGDAPLGLANPFISPNLLSGRAALALRLDGPLALSALSGQVSIPDAGVAIPAARLVLENLSGTITLTGAQARVDLAGRSIQGGRIAVSGPLDLTAPFSADFAIRLRDFALVDPGLYETAADADLTVSGPLTGGARIAGRIVLDTVELRIPETGLGPSSRNFELTHVNTPAPVRRTLDRAGLLDEGGNGGGETRAAPYALDITVSAPSRIFVRGRGLDAELGGDVRIGGTLANIEPVGRFELVRGRLDILGQRLQLSEGSIQLQGDFNPRILLVASTQRDEILVTIRVEGPIADPEVTFASVPERPEEEVLSLLLFGRDLSQISALQALRIAAAVNTLAGRGGGGIIENLRLGFGLDDFDIQTDPDGTTGVRFGKYLGENLYTDLNVNSAGETAINLNLEITPSITARGSAGSGGETSLGIFFERDY